VRTARQVVDRRGVVPRDAVHTDCSLRLVTDREWDRPPNHEPTPVRLYVLTGMVNELDVNDSPRLGPANHTSICNSTLTMGFAGLDSCWPVAQTRRVPEKRERRTPTMRGRQLGAELKRLRTAAGLTADQVADALGCSQGKISRIELAQTGVSKGDLFLMLDLYGVTKPQVKERYWRLAREARDRGWWEDYREIITGDLSAYIAFEADAIEVKTWSWGTIAGLLQTPDYARSTFEGAPAGHERTASEIQKLVEARMARQRRLDDGSLKLWAILDESLLHRPIGGTKVLKEQLGHLLVLPSNVTIQVMRQQTTWHAGLNGAFTIMSFHDHPAAVFVESMTGDMGVDGETDIQAFTLGFDYLRAAAASVEESRALILQAQADL
jgi:transcriptional regulator with XRE-family HTH domain